MTIEDALERRRVVSLEKPLFYPEIPGLLYIAIDGVIYFYQGNKPYNEDTISEVLRCGCCIMGYAIQSITISNRNITVSDPSVEVGIYSQDLEKAVDTRSLNQEDQI